jgi:malto-oligosyltrehalose trehalohydrolase
MPVTEHEARATMPFGAQLLPDGGVAFRLWAPSEREATVIVDGVRSPMEALDGGWFACTVADARAGSRYAFAFPNLEAPVADPASRFQPEGVHAPSMVVDPLAYRWRTQDWRGRPWHEIVLYELHIGTFTPAGTYAAAIDRLDALAATGITAIELMPIAQPAGTRNWGYDGVLPYAPQHAYGTPDELKAFVDAAHARGLCVFLDVVYNHFGPEGNYLNAFAANFFTERHHTPWGSAINVDGENARLVRDFFIDNAVYWLDEYRFDGLRFDAVHEIKDDSQLPFLRELPARVHARIGDRHVHLVLENDTNDAPLLADYDAQWNDDVHHALHVLLTGERDGYYRDYAVEPARLLARALAEGFAYQGEPSQHRGGAPRGTPSATLTTTKFVNFLQNHDQVGNRAFGERISALASAEALRAAYAVLLLAPQIPLLFMGEEWAASTPFLFFSDFGDELGALVTAGRRREFAAWSAFRDPALRERIPDPQLPSTMRSSTLDWDERSGAPHAELLAFMQAALAARTTHIVPHLASGAHGTGSAMLGSTAFIVRWTFGDGARLALVANLGDTALRSSHDVEGARIFGTDGTAIAEDGDVPAWSAAWFLAS